MLYIKKVDTMNKLIELHMHLDGALSINSCKELAKLQINSSFASNE